MARVYSLGDMAANSSNLALMLEPDRVVIVWGTSGGGGRVVVRRVGIAARPGGSEGGGEEPSDETGRLISAAIERMGATSAANGGVTVALSRSDVALKHVALPPGVSSAERPGVAELAMAEQFAATGDSAVVDFVPMSWSSAAEQAEKGSAAGGGGSDLLAAAVAQQRIDRIRSIVCAGAGLKINRLAVAPVGAASLLAGDPAPDTVNMLVLVSQRGGPGGCDILLVRGRSVLMARAADVPSVGEAAVLAGTAATEATFLESIAMEAKRTYMAYRLSPGAGEVRSVLVLGAGPSDALAAKLTERLGSALELAARTIGLPPTVELASGVSVGDAVEAACVVGVLAEEGRSGSGAGSDDPERALIDLGSARRAPDLRAARRRMAALAGAAVLIVCGLGWTMAKRSLEEAQGEFDKIKTHFAKQVKPKHDLYVRQKLRTEHIEGFRKSSPNWIGHLAVITEQMPDPNQAVLESLLGESDPGVEFVWAKGAAKSIGMGKWAPRSGVALDLSGSAKRREIADGIRDRIEQDQRYLITTKGADVSNRFEYRVTSTGAREGTKPGKDKPGAAVKPDEKAGVAK